MCYEHEVEQNEKFIKEYKRQLQLTYSLMQIYNAIEELGDMQTEKMKVLFNELIEEIRKEKNNIQ